MKHSIPTPEDYAVELLQAIRKDPQGPPAQSSKRVQRLIADIRSSMQQPKKTWNEVGSVLDEETILEPLIVRKALAVKQKLNLVPVYLWDGQPVPGSIAFYKEEWMISGRLPKYATDLETAEAGRHGLSVGSIVGHIVPHYPKILSMGVKGIQEQIQERLQTCENQEQRDFCRAAHIAVGGLADFALRYAELCRQQAESVSDEQRRLELIRMAEDLEHSPLNPPETFRQAVNTVWLTHIAFQLTGNSLAVGRLDQHLGSFLENDLAQGRITVEEAQELMDCLLLKFNERALDNRIAQQIMDKEQVQQQFDRQWANRSPFDHSTQKYNVRDSIDATNHWLQNIIAGGVLSANGEDASNLVTVMCLEAFRRNGMTNPCFTVRLHKNSPQFLVDLVGEVLLSGGGLPALFNDEAIVPALLKSGFTAEDARDYTNDGCWEVIVAGRTDFYFDRFNMLRCLEWTLNRGRSRVDGKAEAPDPGDPRKIGSYEELVAFFEKTIDYELKGIMGKIHESFGKRAMIAPTPLLSALLEGPVENAADMTAGGAKYITYGLIAEGVSHVIDSLSAIKKIIFEEHRATMDELIEALDHNYEGYEGLRRLLQSAPKYGSNDLYADAIGKSILQHFTETVDRLNADYPRINFLAAVGTFSWYIAIGEGVGATPDGRLAAQPVSSNFSPSVGADSKGVTGAILSHSQMQMKDLPVGAPIDLRVSSKLVSGPDGARRLSGLIRSFVELGGNMLTLTVADTEILRKAQQEPENYPTLRVRMGGWSAYFTMLSREQQDHHIQKQEML
jgi:formate C-acetyltransferase